MSQIRLCHVLFLLLVAISTSAGLTGSSGAVCSSTTSERKSMMRSTTRSYIAQYRTRCFNLWKWWSCTRSRTQYATAYYTAYTTATKYRQFCCSGFGQKDDTCVAVCSQSCRNGGSCVKPNECRCAPGWTGNDCNTPICASGCTSNGGRCVAPNKCVCPRGLTGPSCSQDIDECARSTDGCQHVCVNSHRSFSCRCHSGFDLLPDGFSCTKQCPQGCEHGDCHRTTDRRGGFIYECRCESGWSGTACNNPVCSDGCSQGTCTEPDVCECEEGWEGDSCSDPVCPGGCVNGHCTAPESCTCARGWHGDQCHVPICSKGCNHGHCTAPESCTCEPGWRGQHCHIPICQRSCLNGGTCISPNTCRCISNQWTGDICETPVCWQECLNGGTCTAPGVCSCQNGFGGDTCHIAMCMDLPALAGSEWNCTIFNNSRSCSLACTDGYDFVFPTNTHVYTCGDDGMWAHTLKDDRSRELPICAKVEPAGFIFTMNSEFEFTGLCEDLTTNKSNQLSATTARQLKEALCLQVNCAHTDVQTDLGNCRKSGDDFVAKRDVESLNRLDVKFTVRVNASRIVTLTEQTTECQAAVANLHRDAQLIAFHTSRVLDDISMSFSSLRYVPRSSVLSDPELRCPVPWDVLTCSSCITCPPGSYRSHKCRRCPVGTFQDQGNQTSCISCSSGKTTLRKGSFSSSHCVHQCPPDSPLSASGSCLSSNSTTDNSTQPPVSNTTAPPQSPSQVTVATLPHVCYPPNHGILSEPWRKVSVVTDVNNVRDDNTRKGGHFQSGWYRFSDAIGGKMPESCPPINRCGTIATGWLRGAHPSTTGELVARKVCFHFSNVCCHSQAVTVKVVNCGGYFVYHLPDTLWYPGGYCGDA